MVTLLDCIHLILVLLKIRINVTLNNGETIHKDWFITRIRSGKDGGSGADAAYVIVAGEQIF